MTDFIDKAQQTMAAFAMKHAMRPSVLHGAILRQEGDRWCAQKEGLCAYGATPDEAMENFGRAWYGKEPKNNELGEDEKKVATNSEQILTGNIVRALDYWHATLPDDPPDEILVGPNSYSWLTYESSIELNSPDGGNKEIKLQAIPVVKQLQFGCEWGFLVKADPSEAHVDGTYIRINRPHGSIDFTEMESYLKTRTGKP